MQCVFNFLQMFLTIGYIKGTFFEKCLLKLAELSKSLLGTSSTGKLLIWNVSSVDWCSLSVGPLVHAHNNRFICQLFFFTAKRTYSIIVKFAGTKHVSFWWLKKLWFPAVIHSNLIVTCFSGTATAVSLVFTICALQNLYRYD